MNSRHPETPARGREGLICGSRHLWGIQGIRRRIPDPRFRSRRPQHFGSETPLAAPKQAGSSLDPAWIQPAWLAGCASWARNPKGPKSHLFGTKWVAIQPFCTSEAGFYAEFRRGSRQIGPTPSISTFFPPFLSPKKPKSAFSGRVSKKSSKTAPACLKCPPRALGGPGALFSAYFWAPGGPWGPPLGGPWGPPIFAYFPYLGLLSC